MRCSPPESVPASCARRSPSRGNNSYASSSAARTPARPRLRRNVSSRFSSTVSDANTERPSGACTMPSRAYWYGRSAGHVVRRRSSTCPAVGDDQARAHPGDRRLARAVGAEQREHAAGAAPRARRRRSRGTARSRRRRRELEQRDAVGLRRPVRRRPSDDVSEVGLAHRVVGEHRLRSGPTRSACRSRGRTHAATRSRTSSTSCSTSRIAMPVLVGAPTRSVAASAAVSCPVETRRRLVEEQQLGLGHQRPADLDEAADTEAERLDRAVGDRLEAEQIEHRLRARLLRRRSAGRGTAGPSTARRGRCAPARRRGSARAASCPLNSSMRWNVRAMPSRARRWVGTRDEVAPVERDRAAVGLRGCRAGS